MIAGDRRVLAIESGITRAVQCLSQRAMGYFVVHVGGHVFGIKKPDATMLGCSFKAVEQRVQRRGTHLFPLLDDFSARQIAEAYLNANYRDVSRADYFGLLQQEFVDTLYERGTVWVPDGDAAFDDGSHILQFDAVNRVRIIAFVNTDAHEDVASTIRDIWMDADLFYAIASGWVTLFEAERASILKAGRCLTM